jgi:hypothetical protein
MIGGNTPMVKPRFQDYLDELARGEAYGIFIDDTGSPGIPDAPPNFHLERKTWVAVIVSPSQIVEVMQQMPQAIDQLRQSVGADEFHFTEIYSGKKQFKNIALRVRLGLFEFMAYIFSYYRFPVIVQTFDPETLADVRSRSGNRLPDSLPPFDFTKCEDLALFFLLLRLKWYMKETETYPNTKARVFIDEGFKNNGIAIRIPTFDDVFADGQICFVKSSSIYPIQLADFAAFSLNRVQLIGGQNQRSSLDKRLLEILSSLTSNYVNIEKKIVPVDQEGPLFTLADTRPNGPYTPKPS